jgi:hypothetical protein
VLSNNSSCTKGPTITSISRLNSSYLSKVLSSVHQCRNSQKSLVRSVRTSIKLDTQYLIYGQIKNINEYANQTQNC